ncbi:MAG: hypothetical protein V2A72_07960 [Candidatus Omnitrophota bacterium]
MLKIEHLIIRLSELDYQITRLLEFICSSDVLMFSLWFSDVLVF